MMAQKLGNHLPASPVGLKSRETVQPAFGEDEGRFARMFEDDLANYRQKEKEQAEARQVRADEEKERMPHTAETGGQMRRDRIREAEERFSLDKEAGSTSGEKPEAAGEETKQHETPKAGAASQTKASGGEASNAAATENSAGTGGNSSKAVHQKDGGVMNPKVQPALIDAGPPEDTKAGSTTTGNGNQVKAGESAPVSNLTSGKLSGAAEANAAAVTGGAAGGQEEAVKSQVADPDGAVKAAEGSVKDQSAQKQDAWPQDIRKNGTAPKNEGGITRAFKAVQDAKSNQTAQDPQGSEGKKDERRPLRLFNLGMERRPVSLNGSANQAGFVSLSALDRQSQQNGLAAGIAGKVPAADAELKVQDGGASASDNNEQQKEFRFSLSNSTGSAGDAASVKKNVMQKLVSFMRQQQVQKNQQTELWQKHRLVLDDGKAVHVASRTAEGLLTLQLGVQNQELNKLLQQHLQEIKAHLQEQFGMNIDVQLQDSGQQGDSELNRKETGGGHSVADAALAGAEGAQQDEQQAPRVRNLGFNTNEWIA